MLKAFRNASHGIFIKILFGAIIFSFCLWGIGDIIKNYAASRAVLSVGKSNITAEIFMREYNQEKQKIRNMGEKPLSDEEIKKIDIKGLVTEKLTQSAILDQALLKFNIIIPKKSIMNVIQSLPEFQNNGVFDETIYSNAIRRSGISEPGFLQQIHESLAKTQLLHPIISGYKIPNIIKENIEKEFEAKKTIVVGKIKLSRVGSDVNGGNIPANKMPTNDETKAYWKEHIEKYKEPEKRDAAILIVDYAALSKDFAISKEEIEDRYKSDKDSFKSVEKRDFERFVFETKEDADKAWNMMNRGTKTSEIKKKLTPGIDEIKGMEKSEFPEKISDELFGLKLTHASNVYSINGKHYIYRVAKIDAPKKSDEKSIKKEIEQTLQNEKMNSPEFYSKIKDMKNKIDDGFGSGKSIDLIAKETGMKIIELKSLTKTEKNNDLSKLIPDEETRTEVQNTIFTTEASQASQTINSRADDTKSYVVYIRNIEKESTPFTKQTAQQVNYDIVNEKEDKKAMEEVNKILNKGKEAADEVSKMKDTNKFSVSKKDVLLYGKEKSKEVQKMLIEIPNTGAILKILSTLKKGEAIHYQLSNGDYILIASKDKTGSSNPTPGFKESISRYMDVGAAKDINSISISAFKSQFKVSVDNAVLDEITRTVDDQEANS